LLTLFLLEFGVEEQGEDFGEALPRDG